MSQSPEQIVRDLLDDQFNDQHEGANIDGKIAVIKDGKLDFIADGIGFAVLKALAEDKSFKQLDLVTITERSDKLKQNRDTLKQEDKNTPTRSFSLAANGSFYGIFKNGGDLMFEVKDIRDSIISISYTRKLKWKHKRATRNPQSIERLAQEKSANEQSLVTQFERMGRGLAPTMY